MELADYILDYAERKRKDPAIVAILTAALAPETVRHLKDFADLKEDIKLNQPELFARIINMEAVVKERWNGVERRAGTDRREK